MALSLYTLAGLLRRTGEFDEAEARFSEALAIFRTALPEDHSLIGRTLLGLGRLYLARSQPAQAEPLLRKGLQIQLDALGRGHWEGAVARSLLGRSLAMQGHQAAWPLVTAGYDSLRVALGPQDPTTQAAYRRLEQVVSQSGHPTQAFANRDTSTRARHFFNPPTRKVRQSH